METVLTQVLQATLTAAVAVVAAMVVACVPKFLAIFQDKTNIQLTEHQRQVVLGAIGTAAGGLETALDARILTIGNITMEHPAVRQQAEIVKAVVPQAVAALGLDTNTISRMIVGRIDTGTHPPTPAAIAPEVTPLFGKAPP